MSTQDLQDLEAHSKKIWADAETVRKRNMELAGKVWERVAQSTVESAWLRAVAEELAIVKSK